MFRSTPAATYASLLRSWSTDDQTFSQSAQVCRVFAESLLQSKPKWIEAEFLAAWQSSVPQVKIDAAVLVLFQAIHCSTC